MDAPGSNSQNLEVLHFDTRPAPMSVKCDKLIVKSLITARLPKTLNIALYMQA